MFYLIILCFQEQLQQELKAAEAAVQSCELEDDWFTAASTRQQHVERAQRARNGMKALSKEEERIDKLHLRRKKVI